ncbi:MAG: Rieske (2Fe-2S) protein [Prosthecobacter sp.]
MIATSACTTCLRRSTRRDWIQRLAMSSAAYTALSGWCCPTSLKAASLNFNERLRLDISAFLPLEFIYNSAFITYDGGQTKILIIRESETDFIALDPTCPHAGCQVNPYSINTNTIFCECHSSIFSIHGQRIGGPAVTDLLSYATQFEGNSTLYIEIPGFVHRIDEMTQTSNSRMRLQFPTMTDAQYQVRWSPDMASPFIQTSFSTTAEGLADQMTLLGTGSTASVYVDTTGNAGFFTLELLISQYA